jgi:uncharacterized protein
MSLDRRDALGALAAGLATPALARDQGMTSEAEIRSAIDRYVHAWKAGDLAAIVACYHDEFVLHYFGRNELAGDHVGKAAALAALAEFGRRTQRRLHAIRATMVGPTRGAILAGEHLGSGNRAVLVERLLVYAVRDGKLSECWVYDADQALIDCLIDQR